jgi:hypothetical protein
MGDLVQFADWCELTGCAGAKAERVAGLHFVGQMVFVRSES